MSRGGALIGVAWLALVSPQSTAPARAEPPQPTTLTLVTPPLSLEEAHARRQKIAGAWLMGIGVPHLAAGIAMGLWNVDLAYGPDACHSMFGCHGFEGPPPGLVAGVPLALVGGVLTAVGMPLYFMGRGRLHRLGK